MLAKKRYYGAARKAGRKVPRFTEKAVAAMMHHTNRDDTYLVGWTLIPRNMMRDKDCTTNDNSGRGAFLPVDALDCAGFRGRGQGVLVARVTKDANENIHPVSISHMLAAEGDLSIGSHIASEIDILGAGVMNNSSNLTILDGGPALLNQVRMGSVATPYMLYNRLFDSIDVQCC